MSAASVSTIISRIKLATKDSPIAVFRDDESKKWSLNAVFADTHETHYRMRTEPERFVGQFDNTMDMFEIKDILRKAVS